MQMRHRLAGNWFAFPLKPVPDHRLGDFVRGVVLERRGDNLPKWLWEMRGRQFADLLGQAAEDGPVGAGFPARWNGGAHRVNEGVQVGGVEVVLLIPGRRREDDIRV